MKRHATMRRKYFFRKLVIYLLCITFPILIIGIEVIHHYRRQLHSELSSSVEQSRDFVLSNITGVFNVLLEETLAFSSTPSLALSISKLLNEVSLDYKNSVYKNLISSIISSSANLNDYVDSIYIYFENPYGNYFDSSKDYTSIYSPKSIDTEWLTIYENAPDSVSQWITCRQVSYYSFQDKKDTISIFRRFDVREGVMILNLDMEKISQLLATNQLYSDSYTLITDSNSKILFGSTGYSKYEQNFPNLLDIDTQKSITTFDYISIDNTNYIYFTSDIPGFDLKMISLIPRDSAFKTINSTIMAFFIIMVFSILVSFILSLTITHNNFKQLQMLLNLFHKVECGDNSQIELRINARNEYDLIFNNIVQTFINNNMLQLNLAQAKMQQKDAQLAALQLQINPHFIFNTLQTIDIDILRDHPSNNHSSMLIHYLSDILKYSLENTFKTVQIKDEIAICKIYAEIQKYRYETPFILYFDYDDDVLTCPMIHLIFQPLLENCLHHGIKELQRKGLVKIKIYKRNGLIQVYIIDNGIGIDKETLEVIRKTLRKQDLNQTTHIGIYNTNMRLVLTYGPESRIHIRSKKDVGTIVSFTIKEVPTLIQ